MRSAGGNAPQRLWVTPPNDFYNQTLIYMPTKNKRSQYKRTYKRSHKKRSHSKRSHNKRSHNKRSQYKRSHKMQRGGMQSGGFFSFFNSNLKPKNLVDKKTPEDIFKMKQPILIEDDFFEKYKDELDTLAIPADIREALQMMMDMKHKDTVFKKCYQGKGTGNKVHLKTPMPVKEPVPEPVAEEEDEEEQAPAAQEETDDEEEQAPAVQQEPAVKAPAVQQAPAAPAPAPAPKAPTVKEAPAAKKEENEGMKGGGKSTRRSQLRSKRRSKLRRTK
jgi:hypothetical protein